MRPIIYIAISTLLVFTGCGQIIDYDIPIEKPIPVVNAFITPDSIFSINLTGSRHVLDNNYTFLPLADYEVRVFQEDLLIGEAVYMENGNYILEDYYPENGFTYSIEINRASIQTVRAKDHIPKTNPAFSILSYKVNEEDYLLFHIFELEIENPEEESFFEIVVFGYNYFYDWSPSGPPIIEDSSYMALPVYTDNPIAENSADFYGRQSILFSNNLIGDNQFKFEIKVGFIPFKDRYDNDQESEPIVDIVVRQVSEDYFYYQQSFWLHQESQGDPLAEPVQVYNNIENGLGIFGSFVQSKESYLVPYPN